METAGICRARLATTHQVGMGKLSTRRLIVLPALLRGAGILRAGAYNVDVDSD